jgi:DNA-binding CsgD family transcriptional regulator
LPSADFVNSIAQRSDGIPLHIEELVAADPHSAVLETVADAVGYRLERLDPVGQSVVSSASVIGRSFDVSLLEKVVAETPDTISSALRAATELHILVRHEDGSYGFRHSIICDIAYDRVPPRDRPLIHSAVAKAAALARLGRAFVSEHFERAGEHQLAFDHALGAAEEAERVSAHRDAADLYARAARTMPATTDPRLAASVHERLATELAASDSNENAAEHFEAAMRLYTELGDDLAVAALVPQLMAMRHLAGEPLAERVALADTAVESIANNRNPSANAVRVRLLGALAAAYMLDRRLSESIAHGEHALELAGNDMLEETIDIRISVGASLVFLARGEEGWAMLELAIRDAQTAGFERAASRGFRMIGSSASVLLEYPRALEWIAEGLAYTAKTERWNDHHYLVAHSAHVNWALGRWPESHEAARRSLTDGHGITTRITGLLVIGFLALARGRNQEALRALNESLELGERIGEVQRTAPAMWGLAELALREGRADEAERWCESGCAASEAISDVAYLFPFVVTGVRAHLKRRNVTAAKEWVERCARAIGLRPLAGTEHAVSHARGLVAMAEGHTGKARELLESALDGWIALGRRWEAVHCLVDLAECARRSRRHSDAVALLARATTLTDGAEGLERVVDSLVVTSRGVGALSAREFEVAGLIATGATNREIALALTIAPKTASAHVEHILAKLGVSRRAEIASWVAGQPGSRGRIPGQLDSSTTSAE